MITITFGDQAENHAGMQKIGKLSEKGSGFSRDDLEQVKNTFEMIGGTADLIDLSTQFVEKDDEMHDAHVLVLRDGVQKFIDCFDLPFSYTDMWSELVNLDWDRKAFMRGRVVNKHARWNLCFSNFDQEPEYESGKGRVIDWNRLPCLVEYRNKFREVFTNSKADNLEAEGNYYYNPNKCYIGYHGDSERRKVIAIRLGEKKGSESFPLYYQWYLRSEKVGEPIVIPLNSGDIYIMSEKAVGTDWKRRIIYTLRHATGKEENI
jgi:hypothetical protein